MRRLKFTHLLLNLLDRVRNHRIQRSGLDSACNGAGIAKTAIYPVTDGNYLISLLNAVSHQHGRSDGGYIGIYNPKIILPYKFFMWLLVVLFTCGTLTCFDFEIGMTS